MRARRTVVLVVMLFASAAPYAQWLNYPAPGIPRLADGKPDLMAPVPRTTDGRPDVSGLWLPQQPYVKNRGTGSEPGVVPFRPWAEALHKLRYDTFERDDPSARCVPGGVPRINLIPYPFRIISAPGRVVILYEISQIWREIFTDGRELPQDPNPTWMGYSVGQWDGDAFVVRSAGFNGLAWLDSAGRPTTDALHVTERFRRKDFGRMDLEITIDDAKAYTSPWTVVVPLAFQPDTELLEYICNENNKYPDLVPR